MITQQQIEDALSVLNGSVMWTCRRTADLFSFHFGDRHQTATFRGKRVEVGEYALNVQCMWRIAHESQLVMGKGDLYRPKDERSASASFDWRTQPNRLDHLIEKFFQKQPFVVSGVRACLAASACVNFEGGFSLEIFPEDSTEEEHWRLLRPGKDDAHFVVTGKAMIR